MIDDVVQQDHDLCDLVLQCQIDDTEIVFCVENIEVFYHFLIRNVPLTEADSLVEYRESIAHASVSLLSYDCQGLLLIRDTFFFCHHLQMVDGVLNGHALKVILLAA